MARTKAIQFRAVTDDGAEDERLTLDLIRLVVEHAMMAGPSAGTPFLEPVLNDARTAPMRAEHQSAFQAAEHDNSRCRWCRLASRVVRSALSEVDSLRALARSVGGDD